MIRRASLCLGLLVFGLYLAVASASTVVFFDSSQITTPVASGVTSDTIRSNGYLFTYTRDKLFTGGIGPDPIGRQVRVHWPQGVEAQAVTVPPAGVTDHKARIVIERADGDVFDLTSLTFKLLANTAGAGADVEIMPSLNGEDGFNDPLYFNASGYYGQSFSYDESPDYWGSTALLKGFDRYSVSLYVDFAFTALAFVGGPVPGPPGDYNNDGIVNAADYTLWRNNFGAPAGSLLNDVDGGTIGPAQYATWKARFGTAAGAGATASSMAVPEPTGLVLLVMGAARIRWRRRST